MTGRRFRVRLVFEGDWHVGAGSGLPGHVDARVARDHDDLPFVPAKTLFGIWRDACETMVAALAAGSPLWRDYLPHLFGDQPAFGTTGAGGLPRPAALALTPARLPATLRRRLAGDGAAAVRLRSALTFLKAGVKIDPATGRALDDHLRFEEMARGGAVLEAEGTLAPMPAGGGADDIAWALLVGATRLVERIGGNRRRGAGRCRLEVVDADLAAAADTLRAAVAGPPDPSAGAEPGLAPEAPRSEIAPDGGADGPVADLYMTLEVESPIVVSRAVVGNVVESWDFVPGAMLLPHVHRSLASVAGDEAVRRAIREGALRVSPATVAVGDDRGLAAPRALRRPKGAATDEATEAYNELQTPGPAGEQLRGVGGYLSLGTDGIAGRRNAPALVVRTHNTIDDVAQSPRGEEQGGQGPGVYSYEAIAPGQRLVARLRLSEALSESLHAARPGWWRALDGTVRLGRSRKDDYGLGRVTATPSRAAAWMPKTAGRLHVWVVTPTVLLDERLMPDPTLERLRRVLEAALGVTLTPAERDGARLFFGRAMRLDGWHTGWQLPRPSLVALAPGSCAAFELQSGTPAPEALRRVMHEGVGERRAEGLGEVVLNHPLLHVSTAALPAATETVRAPEAAAADDWTPELRDYAAAVEEAVWKRLALDRAAAIAADADLREARLGLPRPGPRDGWTRSQTGALGTAIRQISGWHDRSVLDKFVKGVEGNERRREKWPQRTLERLREMQASRDAVWDLLAEAAGEAPAWPRLAPAAAEPLEERLWSHALQALWQSALDAHRRDCEAVAERGDRR